MLPKSTYHEAIHQDPDPNKRHHQVNPATDITASRSSEDPSMAPHPSIDSSFSSTLDRPPVVDGENADHVIQNPPLQSSSNVPRGEDIHQTYEAYQPTQYTDDTPTVPQSSQFSLGFSFANTDTQVDHMDYAKAGHVLDAPLISKSPSADDLHNDDPPYLEVIARKAGGNQFRLPHHLWINAQNRLKPAMRAEAVKVYNMYDLEISSFPTGNFIVEEFLEGFKTSDYFFSYMLIQSKKIAMDISAIVPELKSIQKRQKEYEEMQNQQKKFNPVANNSNKATLLGQIRNAQLEIDALPVSAIDERGKRAAILLDLKSQYTAAEKADEEHEHCVQWLRTHALTPEDQKRRDVLLQRIRGLVYQYKIISGTHFFPNKDNEGVDTTEGVFIYVRNNFANNYDWQLKHLLSDVLTSKEDEKLIEHDPENYYVEVRQIFQDAQIRNYLTDLAINDDEVATVLAKWNTAEKIATINITSKGDAPPIQGYALFFAHVHKLQLIQQAHRHFDLENTKVNMKAIHCDFAETTFADPNHKSVLLLQFSFTGNGPKEFIRLKRNKKEIFSQFTVIAQTETVCRYCHIPGHSIRDCNKFCDTCKQKHKRRYRCRSITCLSCHKKHYGHYCDRSSKRPETVSSPPNIAERDIANPTGPRGHKRNVTGTAQHPDQQRLNNRPVTVAQSQYFPVYKLTESNAEGFQSPKKTAKPVAQALTPSVSSQPNFYAALSVEEPDADGEAEEVPKKAAATHGVDDEDEDDVEADPDYTDNGALNEDDEEDDDSDHVMSPEEDTAPTGEQYNPTTNL